MKQGLRTVGFMVLIATVFGAGVTGIRLATRDTLVRNRNLAYQRAVVNVFRLAEGVAEPDYAAIFAERVVEETLRDPDTGREMICYRAYGKGAASDRSLVAVGFQFVGAGFWGPISGILALTPDRGTTFGLAILEQQETPGLGGRVAESEFLDQFYERTWSDGETHRGVLVTPPSEGRKAISVATSAPDDESRHVDAITGATQTSMSMDRILNDALAAYRRAYAAAAPEGGTTDGTL